MQLFRLVDHCILYTGGDGSIVVQLPYEPKEVHTWPGVIDISIDD